MLSSQCKYKQPRKRHSYKKKKMKKKTVKEQRKMEDDCKWRVNSGENFLQFIFLN